MQLQSTWSSDGLIIRWVSIASLYLLKFDDSYFWASAMNESSSLNILEPFISSKEHSSRVLKRNKGIITIG